MVDDPNCWLSFSLTPVQGFVAAARTVRDLKVGSELLCYLVGKAIDAGISAGGELLYPALRPGEARRNIPNRFVMAFSTGTAAEHARGRVVEAAEDAWKQLAEDVRTQLDDNWSRSWSDWDRGWGEQIQSYWEIRALLLCSDQVDVPGAYAQLFPGKDAEPLRQQWELLAAAVDASKQVRHFPGDQGAGRDKCTMMGDLEQMGPTESLAQMSAFWDQARAYHPKGLRIREAERLCAISLVKRFAPLALPEPLQADLLKRIPDTASIATADWCARLQAMGGGAELAAFERAVTELRQAEPEEAETPSRCLLDDTLKGLSGLDPLPAAHRRLLKRADQAGLGPPPRYFAILHLDGDEMGKRLSGAYCRPGELTPRFYREISRRLRDYAEHDAPYLVEAHRGYTVYAGGDDLLALLPLRQAPFCARLLRTCFPPLPDALQGSSASVGLVFCHYTHDLRDALQQTREALHSAKEEMGRDCCSIRLLKRSGGDTRMALSWEMLARVRGLCDAFTAGASDRWVYRLGGTVPSIGAEVSEEAPLRLLIRHFAERTEGGDGNLRQRMLALALELWEGTHTFLDERHTRQGASLEARGLPNQLCPTKEHLDFWATALRAFVDAVGIATFLARGGRP